ncbi:MAG: ABC transporter substrate-binding protein, partial [Chloroflexota bacterium]
AGSNFIMGSAVPVPSIDPAIGSDDAETNFMEALYDTLYRYQGTPPKLMPWLAKSASVNKAGTVWTVHLRSGVTFANGDPLTASDVAYSFDRLLAIKQGYSYLFSPFLSTGSVKAVNPTTVSFTLNHPFSPFLQMLPYGYIVDQKQVVAHQVKGDKGKAWLTDHAAGSGPYVISSWTPNQDYVLTKNTHFWGGWSGAHLDTVDWKVIPDLSARQLALKVGNVQAINWLSVTSFDAMKTTPGITAIPEVSAEEFMVNLNTQSGPTADPNLRKAIAYAVDYNTVIKVIFGGYGAQIGAPVPRGFKGYQASLAPITTDMNKAKQYLAKSKYPHGTTITYTYVTGLDEERRLGLLLLSDLAPLGIKVNVVAEAWPSLVSQEAKPTTAPSMSPLYFQAQYDSPYNWLYSQYSSTTLGSWQNEAQFNNPTVDKLMALGAQSTDAKKALQNFAKAQTMIVTSTPAIYLLQNKILELYSSKLNWPYSPLGASSDFYHMSMSS